MHAMLLKTDGRNFHSESHVLFSIEHQEPARMAAPTANTSAGCQALDTLQAQILQHKDNFTSLGTIRAPAFVNTPGFRGITSILDSCVVTLVACIYTALRLNVPAKSGLAHTVAYKGKWVFIGLMAPELVLYLAISQFVEARILVKELNKLLKKDAHAEIRKSSSGDVEAGTHQGHSDGEQSARPPDNGSCCHAFHDKN